MTPTQVDAVLMLRAKAWPYATLGAGEGDVWANVLACEPEECAIEAILGLVRSDQRPPTVARFVEMRRALARAEAPKLPAAPEFAPSEAVWRNGLAQCRAVLAASRASLPERQVEPVRASETPDG